MEQSLSVTSNFVLRRIADESILVPVSPQLKNRDCLFVLNETGYVVYAGIRGGQSLGQIERSILEDFDGVTAEQARSDITQIIDQMIEIEAIRA